jgi:hypothetical protein
MIGSKLLTANADYLYHNADYCNAYYQNAGLEPHDMPPTGAA